ncbi:hypothetical protein [Pseudonocardia broussonetiae]|uniref:Uncharacterized protein n=1 Tax=Pseudonocardia broussonetiae TaxID=2736640 RepID=A0A6M6JD75_9PSEU|nr:hypothetical protein [Pseudonocardia broussonetiae]QJY45526.1 hypothetical protein HOP40_06675 [Pseudonocardia broussonetiae]
MDTASTVPDTVIVDFLAGLQRCGIAAVVQGVVVVFTVEAVTGARAGRPTPTGVHVDELSMWPQFPPHWVHFPADVGFSTTNANAEDTLPGWVRHSRQINGWGDAAEPAQAWIAHIRSVLETAS